MFPIIATWHAVVCQRRRSRWYCPGADAQKTGVSTTSEPVTYSTEPVNAWPVRVSSCPQRLLLRIIGIKHIFLVLETVLIADDRTGDGDGTVCLSSVFSVVLWLTGSLRSNLLAAIGMVGAKLSCGQF